MKDYRSLLAVAVLAGPLVFNSLSAIADETSNKGKTRVVEHGARPELIADAIVIFRPNANMALNRPERMNRPLRGSITKVERGVVTMEQIEHKAGSIIAPLRANVPVKLFLKRYPGQEAKYYLIAILPTSYGGLQ